MPWRFAGRAEDRIDDVILESARRWGIQAAGRYNRLIFAAIDAVGEDPVLAGSRPIADLPGVRSYHLRSARKLVPAEHRVGEPRHLVVYRVAESGAIEILSLVHDRQRLGQAARRAQREAGG
jgi:plasmid stabilization system protein ParE